MCVYVCECKIMKCSESKIAYICTRARSHLIGDEQQVQSFHGLIHVADRFRFYISVLVHRVYELRKCCEQALDANCTPSHKRHIRIKAPWHLRARAGIKEMSYCGSSQQTAVLRAVFLPWRSSRLRAPPFFRLSARTAQETRSREAICISVKQLDSARMKWHHYRLCKSYALC